MPRTKFNKGCEGYYTENYKVLLKEIEKNTMKQKDTGPGTNNTPF